MTPFLKRNNINYTNNNNKNVNLERCEELCLIEHGMRILGGKRKAFILWHLKDGPVRSNKL